MRLCLHIWVSLAVVAQHRDEQYQLLLVRGPDPGKRRKSRSALSNFFMVRAFAPPISGRGVAADASGPSRRRRHPVTLCGPTR
jgi:hypothetical protein